MNRASNRVLLDRWRRGDNAAGQALLVQYAPALQRFFERRVGQDADDLLQRTLLSFVVSLARVRDAGTLRTYLFTIARHELYRFYRQRAARGAQLPLDELDLPGHAAGAEADLLERERTRALKRALAACSEADRRLLCLFYASDADSRVLSGQLGIKPSSVRARLHRARTELRRAIDDAQRESDSQSRSGSP